MRSSFYSVRSGTPEWLVLALAILALSNPGGIQAQQEPTQGKQAAPTQSKQTVPTQATPPPKNPPAIDIKVETFRKQIVPGDTVGVVADITNSSSAPVYLRQQDVQLFFALEVERTGSTTDGWFPTENREKDPVLCLRPGETYRVPFPPAPTSWDFKRWFQFINFVPGTYPITVEAKYWDQANFNGGNYHTAVVAKTAEYSAPQSIILVGAILGGLIFTGLSMVRSEQSALSGVSVGALNAAVTYGKIAATLIGSVLLSVIITILLSRIEQTQFFVKVSVSDFWGAIAVGFLANYGGWALLDKMVPGAGKGQPQKQTQTTTNPMVQP